MQPDLFSQPAAAPVAEYRQPDPTPMQFDDCVLLQLALLPVMRREKAATTARALLDCFGSFAETIHAEPVRIAEVAPRDGKKIAQRFALYRAMIERMLNGQLKKRPVLSSWSAVLDYCRAAQAFAPREQLRIIYLDKKNYVITDEIMHEGTVDHTPVYPREVVRRAIVLNATAVILVHNHPSGDPTPSRADIEMTQAIIAAARPLGISIHDHIVVGKDGHASLKGMRLI
jgi:DNA repair protein RadC